MRAGLTVSIIGHAALIGFGFLAFPEARPFEVGEIQALPVDLIDVAELTDLAAGNEDAEELPEEEPQPIPPVQAEAPSPEPAEERAEEPVEVARPPEARPEPPPEPEPEAPSEEVAALPEPEDAAELRDLAEAEEPVPPVEPRLPHRRPKPPAVAREPAEEPPEMAEEVPEQEFNADDIAALLNKQDPAGGGSPNPPTEPQTLGSVDGHAEAAMTQSELAALQARLYQCWTPPVGARGAADLVVTVKITLLPDGSVVGQPELMGIGGASSPLAQVAAENAVRAVLDCAPYGDILRPENYALWREIIFDFDPQFMLGG